MQRVLVTGANRGIGLEFTRQLLARDARVFATCRNPGNATKLTELAAKHPGRLTVLPLELPHEHSIAGLVREVGALTNAIDVLINNAGMLVSDERFGAITGQAMSDSFASNVIGPLLLTQALDAFLEKGTNAKVMNISSKLGSIAGTTDFYTPSYGISKAALNMATRQLAAALRPHNVSVFCVHPGWVQTDMGGAKAPVTPAQSVTGLLRVLDNITTKDAGSFIDFEGKPVHW